MRAQFRSLRSVVIEANCFLEERHVDEILASACGPLVLQESFSADDVEFEPEEIDALSRLPGLFERNSVDASEDVDAPGLMAQHEDSVWFSEFLDCWGDGAETKSDQRSANARGVPSTGFDEDVEILSQACLNVEGEGVSPNQKKVCVR